MPGKKSAKYLIGQKALDALQHFDESVSELFETREIYMLRLDLSRKAAEVFDSLFNSGELAETDQVVQLAERWLYSSSEFADKHRENLLAAKLFLLAGKVYEKQAQELGKCNQAEICQACFRCNFYKALLGKARIYGERSFEINAVLETSMFLMRIEWAIEREQGKLQSAPPSYRYFSLACRIACADEEISKAQMQEITAWLTKLRSCSADSKSEQAIVHEYNRLIAFGVKPVEDDEEFVADSAKLVCDLAASGEANQIN